MQKCETRYISKEVLVVWFIQLEKDVIYYIYKISYVKTRTEGG
jgi:hypothetical protein